MSQSNPIFIEPVKPQPPEDPLSFWTLDGAVRLMQQTVAPASCIVPACTALGKHLGGMLCMGHAAKTWEEFDALESAGTKAIRKAETAKEQDALASVQEAAHAAMKASTGVVYYIQVGERIKIGFTRNFKQRSRAYPPTAELLATHPGGPEVEREMHHRFRAHLSDGREWFSVNPELLDHIKIIKSQHPQVHKLARLKRPARPAPKVTRQFRRVA